MASRTRSLKSFGCGTRESQSAEPVDRSDCAQEIGEVVGAITIGVDRLPQENDLGQPIGDGGSDLPHDVDERPTALGPACRRHDAVGAAIVTSPLDRDPRFDPRQPPRAEIFVVLLASNMRLDTLRARPRPLDQRRECAVPIGPNDQTHVARAGQQLRTQPLRHAPGDTEDRIARHIAPELTEAPEHALLGVVSDRTSVDQDNVRAVADASTGS